MYLLTYERQDGYPVKLVFDSHREAQYWGSKYSIKNNTKEYTVSAYPSSNLFSYTTNFSNIDSNKENI